MSIKELSDKFEEIKKNFTEQLIKEFLKETKTIFEKYPLLNSFAWPQYTMGFNDGDPCYFSVYSDSININSEGEDDWNWVETGNKTSWGSNEVKLSEKDQWKDDCSKDIGQLVSNVPEEILQNVYREGLVTVNKSGVVKVDIYYDHD